MIQIVLLILILLLPIPTEAVYKIYLKDGSVISGVEFYEKQGSDIDLFFKDGSMHVPEEEILRIEEKEYVRSYFPLEDVQGVADDTSVTVPPEQETDTSEKIARLKALKADIDALNEEIRAANLEEVNLVTTINEKRNEKTVWNKYQVMQLENELQPLSEELRAVQQKKIELLEKKGSLETKISELQK